jgi:hypothetical protein
VRHRTITSRPFHALLASGEPYSVVLPTHEDEFTVIYEEEASAEPYIWWGVPCRFVRLYFGLRVLERPTPRPFTLRALLPLRDVEDTIPFIRLGAEFLYANQAGVELESVPWRGRLIIP